MAARNPRPVNASSLEVHHLRSTVLGLARASHFQPTLAVTAAATGLAVMAGRGVLGCIAVALAVLCGQLSTGWSNDWFDAARDTEVGRMDKPIVAGMVTVRTVRASALIAIVLVGPLSLLSGWRAALIHVVAVGSAWAYNAGLKSTIVSPLPYGLSFALLPAFVTLGLPGHPWPRADIMVITGLLGIGAHFINTLADRADDRSTGVRGLPQRLPASVTLSVGVAVFAVCACMIRSIGGRLPLLENLILAASFVCDALVIGAVATDRPRAAWSWTLAATVACLALFVVARPPLVT